MAQFNGPLRGAYDGLDSPPMSNTQPDDASDSDVNTEENLQRGGANLPTPNSVKDLSALIKATADINLIETPLSPTHNIPDTSRGSPSRYNNIGAANNHSRSNFRNSRTWMSPDTKHMQDFVIVRNAMRRLFKNSEVAKWKYADYIAHREAVIASEKATLDRKLKVKEEERLRAQMGLDVSDFTLSLGANVRSQVFLQGNYSLVLGEKTIWCVDWQSGKDEIAPWPTFAEMKWEGDDRAKTAVGRYLPLPREMGAPGITWSQLQCVEQYPLDQVARIPTMEDIYLPVDEIEEEMKGNLIMKSLEDAMDEYLEA